MIRIQNATKEQSADIARFIMMAMTDDCCLHFCGAGYGLEDFRKMMTRLAKEHLGKDHSGMDDETQQGELYLDSLAVLPKYRHQGIARKLLLATKERADRLGLPVGLLVDYGNPIGEALYLSMGFRYVNDNSWGGHTMKHLVL